MHKQVSKGYFVEKHPHYAKLQLRVALMGLRVIRKWDRRRAEVGELIFGKGR